MTEKKRMANQELLRCVAMMMVIVLHYLGKGGLLKELTEPGFCSLDFTAWGLESLCIVAVNVYMLISGYFLCESSFKFSRLINLYLQIWVYSFAVGMIGAFTGIMEKTEMDIHFFLTLIFPVNMEHYWFLTAYLFLYVLLPLLTFAVKRMTKQQMQVAVALLVFAFSISKSVLPLRMEMDTKGYHCLWYLTVFLVAAYIRRFGISLQKKKWTSLFVYLVSVALIFGCTMGLRAFYLKTGSFDRMLGMCMEYNHILVLIASVGLFCFFGNLKVGGGFERVICRIAPYTLGVYLLHENLGLRYSWQNLFGADKVNTPMGLIMGTVCAMLCVFTAGILIDMVRAFCMGVLHRGLMKVPVYQKVSGWIYGIDALMKTDELVRTDEK